VPLSKYVKLVISWHLRALKWARVARIFECKSCRAFKKAVALNDQNKKLPKI